jgi:hypothetical protein
MTCYYKSFTRKKKEGKEVGKRRIKRKKMIEFMNNTPMLTNWVQIGMGKIFKTINVHHNKF